VQIYRFIQKLQKRFDFRYYTDSKSRESSPNAGILGPRLRIVTLVTDDSRPFFSFWPPLIFHRDACEVLRRGILEAHFAALFAAEPT
jgi:hypothetical protein